MEFIIKVKNLKKYFKDIKAIDGIDFDVKKGEIFVLLGPDGAGKTTILRLLSGLLNQTDGSIDISGYKLPEDSEKVKEHIGYMPQKFSLYTDLTVEENVNFFAEIYRVDKNLLNERLKPLLEMTRLYPFKDRLAGNLSGGMKQKLALMCTLIHRPDILILDEPTTGVDPVSRREFWEILQNIRAEKVTIILSTPYMDEAEWCSRVGLIYKGKILALDSPSQLKNIYKLTVVEIYFNDKKKYILDSIKNMEGIIDYKILGNKIHIIIESDRTYENIIKNFGEKFELKRIYPDIEDIFVKSIKTKRKNL